MVMKMLLLIFTMANCLTRRSETRQTTMTADSDMVFFGNNDIRSFSSHFIHDIFDESMFYEFLQIVIIKSSTHKRKSWILHQQNSWELWQTNRSSIWHDSEQMDFSDAFRRTWKLMNIIHLNANWNGPFQSLLSQFLLTVSYYCNQWIKQSSF